MTLRQYMKSIGYEHLVVTLDKTFWKNAEDYMRKKDAIIQAQEELITLLSDCTIFMFEIDKIKVNELKQKIEEAKK